MKGITISQSLTAAELTNGSLVSLRYTRISTIFCLIYGVVILNMVFNFINPHGIYNDGETSYNVLIIVTILPFAIFLAIRNQAATALKKKERYYKDTSFTITPEYIKSEGEGYSNTYRWKEIVKVKETKNWYLIYINKQQALIIHKSNIDEWQKDELDDIFKAIKAETKVSLQ